ncbi:Hemerythrin HHE cation binding domain protein [Actinomadura rubteroloni]|uniref:Hemerythrin HHE cation binding domain protein n=1 Tax=Actinomadura rubteroloni TaxID=1926885 RepID=A0A2P4UC85_9ACTN|nr:hemerythrin domain-containing protein [Actinomadura rubteroloni]POM22658.1 Hemerythrin HHE cation binding domain protein [Actinomadura rubteroloni]
METPDTQSARLAAFGDQLIEVHDWLRAELARLSEGVDARLDGGPAPEELRAHCLTFCTALERHHTGEDGGAFVALAERHPDLAPVLDKLREDHRLVSDILRRLRELVAGIDPRAADPRQAQRVRGELDGLMAIMESHFAYEERSIVTALNALDVPEWEERPPEFLRTDPAT